jgi:hypothetical protein
MTDQERKRKKRPRDANQLAKSIVDIATGEEVDVQSARKRSKMLAAVQLGRRGGLKGGPARAASLSADEREKIARRAAKIRWQRKKDETE